VNAWQLARQIRTILRAHAWADGTGEVVWSNRVYVSAGLPEDQIGKIGTPFCLVYPGAAESDAESSNHETTALNVVLTQRVAGDPTGEVAMLGGPRTGGQGSSKGRGLLELEAELHRAIDRLNEEDHGVSLYQTSMSAPEARIVDGATYMLSRLYVFEARVTKRSTFPPVTQFLATAPGAGVAALTWVLPAARYDRLQLVLRRAAGATAPASPTAGTSVVLGSALPSAHNDTPTAGTWSYSLFVGYDELGAAAVDRYSPAATLTVVVV
jgi:hypothetical protein